MTLTRTVVLLLGTFMYCGLLSSQTVNIPDINFKNALLNIEGLDANSNGEIEYTEAESLKVITLDQLDIQSLTGIEAFVNLIELTCSGNTLTSLDVSKNVKLDLLYCSGNSELDCIQVNQNQLTNIPFLWQKESTANYKLNCGTTSILDNSANHFNFSVYPNPFDSEFSITNSFGKNADKLELYSLNGVLLNTLDSSKQTHSLEGLSSGSYILQVTYKDRVSNHKIVKL